MLLLQLLEELLWEPDLLWVGFVLVQGLCALSIGKIDAMVFFLGGLTGAFLFAETYPFIQKLANGSYKGPVKINEVMGISPGLFTFLLIVAAVAMFWIAEIAEKNLHDLI
jgi:hypothetical protein